MGHWGTAVYDEEYPTSLPLMANYKGGYRSECRAIDITVTNLNHLLSSGRRRLRTSTICRNRSQEQNYYYPTLAPLDLQKYFWLESGPGGVQGPGRSSDRLVDIILAYSHLSLGSRYQNSEVTMWFKNAA